MVLRSLSPYSQTAFPTCIQVSTRGQRLCYHAVNWLFHFSTKFLQGNLYAGYYLVSTSTQTIIGTLRITEGTTRVSWQTLGNVVHFVHRLGHLVDHHQASTTQGKCV